MNSTQTYAELVEKNKQLEESLAVYTITKDTKQTQFNALLSSINRAGLSVVKTVKGYELSRTINSESI